MDSVEKVQSILGKLTKPLYKDDPFSAGGRKIDFDWTDGNKHGLSFQAFINRILTFKVQNWGADPNAALYLAKYGFENVSDCKVQCCSCNIEVDMDVFRGKLDILRTIAARSHKPNCCWLHVSTPAEYFKIPRNPRKFAEDFLITVKDLMTFRDELPLMPEQIVLGQFTKTVMEALNLTDESQILLSSIYIGLCGWVKASDTTIQCNFCQRVFGIWNFINVHEALHGRPIHSRTEGRVVSILLNQIRGEAKQHIGKNKNDSLHQSQGSYLSRENESHNKDSSFESKSSENMSNSNCSDELYEDTNYEPFKAFSRSYFCAQTRKRNAIKILCRKMRLSQRKDEISNSSDNEQSSVQDSECDIEFCGEPRGMRHSVCDHRSKTMMEGNIRNGSSSNELGNSMNLDRDSEIRQNGYSDVEHYEENCVASKTDGEDSECNNEQKSTMFVNKQGLDKQSATFPNNTNASDSVHNEGEMAKKLPSSESKNSPGSQVLSSDMNSKDCDSPLLVNSLQVDSVHEVDNVNDDVSAGNNSTKKEDIKTSIPNCEQNGKSSEQSEETGELNRIDSSFDVNTKRATVKNMPNDISDNNIDKDETTERNNGVDQKDEELHSAESIKCSSENENARNYSEHVNNYEEYNEDNQFSPIIFSVVGNAVMDTSEDDLEAFSPTKENEFCEGPIIVSSNTISIMEMTGIKEESCKTGVDHAEELGDTEKFPEQEMPTSMLNESQMYSLSVDMSGNTSEVISENGNATSCKRKREDDSPVSERIENAKKKLRDARCEALKCSFNPVIDHRFWCIWKIQTSDYTGADETVKAGWQYAFEIIQQGLELIKRDRSFSYCELQEKTIDCVNTICSMGRPG